MRPRNNHERQKALLVLSQWTIYGETVTSSLTNVPIKRPTALDASDSDAVMIRIAAKSAPSVLTVTHYDAVKSDGHHTGDPLRLLAWQHPKIFRQHHASEHARLLKYVLDGDASGWEFKAQVPETAEESYIVLWGQWISPDPRQGAWTYSANWTMSARR